MMDRRHGEKRHQILSGVQSGEILPLNRAHAGIERDAHGSGLVSA
jgi:hypothetical protein